MFHLTFCDKTRESTPKSYCQIKILLGTRCPGATTICMSAPSRLMLFLDSPIWEVMRSCFMSNDMLDVMSDILTDVLLEVRLDRLFNGIVAKSRFLHAGMVKYILYPPRPHHHHLTPAGVLQTKGHQQRVWCYITRLSLCVH